MSLSGEIVRRLREDKGWSQQDLADKVGISQTAIQKIERGETKRSRFHIDIATALGVPSSALSEPLVREAMTIMKTHGHIKAAEPKSNASLPPNYQPFPQEQTPVYGTVAGGDDGRFILNGQRIASVFTPPILNGVDGAYAVFVYGESMQPKFEPGEIVWLHPYLPVKRGDYVVVQMLGDSEADDLQGFVKQFVSRNTGELVLKQLNPPPGQDEFIRLPGSRVFSVHKIVFSQLT